MASIGQDLADLFAAPAPRVTWLMFQPWGQSYLEEVKEPEKTPKETQKRHGLHSGQKSLQKDLQNFRNKKMNHWIES